MADVSGTQDDLQPHNLDAEQALIGAVLVSNEAFDRIRIEPGDFYDPVHGEIWAAISRRITLGQAATATLLRPDFETHAGMAELGGPAYLARLAGAAVAVSTAPDHAEQIKALARKREIIHALRDAQDGMAKLEPDEVAARLEAAMMVVHDKARPTARAVSFASATVAMVEKAMEAYQSDGVAGLTTGIAEIDDKTGGMIQPELWVVGARASMGKTALALHTARRVAEAGGGVLFCSLEMDPVELSQRLVSSMAGTRVPYRNIRMGKMKEEQARAVVETAAEVGALPIEITPPSLRDLGGIAAEVRAAERRLKAKGAPLALVVIDYLQRVQAPGESGVERIGAACAGLKAIAARHGVPVMALAQLNREVEARASQGKGGIPRPMLSDLKGAGDIEQDADVVLLLHRDEYYVARQKPTSSAAIQDHAKLLDACRGKMDIIVAKFRNGAVFEATVDVDLPVNRVKPPAPAVMDQSEFML